MASEVTSYPEYSVTSWSESKGTGRGRRDNHLEATEAEARGGAAGAAGPAYSARPMQAPPGPHLPFSFRPWKLRAAETRIIESADVEK